MKQPALTGNRKYRDFTSKFQPQKGHHRDLHRNWRAKVTFALLFSQVNHLLPASARERPNVLELYYTHRHAFFSRAPGVATKPVVHDLWFLKRTEELESVAPKAECTLGGFWISRVVKSTEMGQNAC